MKDNKLKILRFAAFTLLTLSLTTAYSGTKTVYCPDLESTDGKYDYHLDSDGEFSCTYEPASKKDIGSGATEYLNLSCSAKENGDGENDPPVEVWLECENGVTCSTHNGGANAGEASAVKFTVTNFNTKKKQIKVKKIKCDMLGSGSSSIVLIRDIKINGCGRCGDPA